MKTNCRGQEECNESSRTGQRKHLIPIRIYSCLIFLVEGDQRSTVKISARGEKEQTLFGSKPCSLPYSLL